MILSKYSNPISFYRSEAFRYLVEGASMFYDNEIFYNNVFLFLEYIINNSYTLVGKYPSSFLSLADTLMTYYINYSNNKRIVESISRNLIRSEYRYAEINNKDNDYIKSSSDRVRLLVKSIISCITTSAQNNSTISEYDSTYSKNIITKEIVNSYSLQLDHSNFQILLRTVNVGFNYSIDNFIQGNSWLNATEGMREYFETKYEADVKDITNDENNYFNVSGTNLSSIMGFKYNNNKTDDYRLIRPIQVNFRKMNVNSVRLLQNAENTANITTVDSDEKSISSNNILNVSYLVWVTLTYFKSSPLFHNSSWNW